MTNHSAGRNVAGQSDRTRHVASALPQWLNGQFDDNSAAVLHLSLLRQQPANAARGSL